MKPRLFLDPTRSNPGESLDSCVHEVCHALQGLLVGITPNWVTVIPGRDHSGLTAEIHTVLFDTGFDWSQAWKYWLKSYYSGLVGSAYLSGEYLWERAKTDLKSAKEIVHLYSLSPEQDLACWVDCHRDIKANWSLIEVMARDLQECQILSSEYFEGLLLSPD